MPYSVDRVIVDRSANEQQFRASIITSLAAHVGVTAALLLGPLLWPQAPIMLNIVPVNVVMPPAAAPPPQPAAADEVEEELAEDPEEAVAEPEPVVSEPEPVPRSIEDLRREKEEDAERERAAEAERERAAEAERRRRADEAERRRQAEEERKRQEEEERRQQPQKAARRGAAPPQRQSAQRTGIDLTGAEDDSRDFTVEEFPFAHYLGRIRDLIATRWTPPPRGQYAPQRRAEVFFRIGRNGRLVVQPRMSGASGNTLFDRAAMQAIAQAAPFPPLPREYQGQSLGVGLAFVQE